MKLLPFFLIFTLVSSAYLSAQEEMSIQSGEAEYNGQEISLTGQVEINHELGSIQARYIKLSASPQGNKKFSYLQMKGDVKILFKEGGEIRCQQADLDYGNLKGVFTGDLEHPMVIYNYQKEKPEKNEESKDSFILESHEMTLALKQVENEKGMSQTGLDSIRATGAVHFYCRDSYEVGGSSALFQKEIATKGSLVEDVKITLYSSPEELCFLTNKQKDRIEAQQISLDVNKRLLTFYLPRGTLASDVQKSSQKQIEFSAKKLVWDDFNNILSLQNEVRLKQEGLGELETKEEVRLYQKIVQNKKETTKIVSTHNTLLTYLESAKGLISQIKCQGPLIIDQENERIIFQSLEDDQGNVEELQQVFFDNTMGDVYANHVQIDYHLQNGLFHPTKINMKGNVKIMNRFNGHLAEAGGILQYALADIVNYFPDKNEMLLSSKDTQRVLFFDKVNHVQMSAPALKIKRDPGTSKDSIQGFGDVRFTFIEREFEQLRQRFGATSKLP